MRIGLISDLHQGYHHGQRVHADGPMAGINVREGDFISAAWDAIGNLNQRNVDFIVDGGDMAHVPAPKKRAIQTLIDLIKFSQVPFFSADGNHTSLKGSGDVHLYHILQSECPNFVGIWYKQSSTGAVAVHKDSGYRVGLVPHSYNPEDTIRTIDQVMSDSPDMLVGHWAASDIKYDSAQVPLEFLPTDIPVFLGHYHLHKEQKAPLPNYIGSTERTAWDQWDYPSGVTIYDTDTKQIEYIQHKTRPFIDLHANVDDYLDVLDSEDLSDAMVRLTVTATRQEFGALNLHESKRKAYSLGALAYHHRRAKDKNEEESAVETYEERSLDEAWLDHMNGKKMPKNMLSRVSKLGIEALNA